MYLPLKNLQRVKKEKINEKKLKYLQYILHSKFDIYKLKTPLIIVAGIALKDRVDLISIMVPLEGDCKK